MTETNDERSSSIVKKVGEFSLSESLTDTSLLKNGITVYFESAGSLQNGRKFLKKAILDSSTSILKIKLTGRHQGWFKCGDTLVLGGRELLEHEIIGELPREENTGYLHVYVKLCDISSFSVTDSSGKSCTYYNPKSPTKVSALTSALSSNIAHQSHTKDLTVRVMHEPFINYDEQCREGVLHLVVRQPEVSHRIINSKSFELAITTSDNVECLQKKLEKEQGLLAGSHVLLWNGRQLSPAKSLSSYGLTEDCLLELYDDWIKARAGLAAGQVPKLCPVGTGGSYFIQDTNGKNVAVFKPEDEEPLAINNPKGRSSFGAEGLRRGIVPGEGAVREVAAFLLDHDHFANVPPTALVACHLKSKEHTSDNAKIGSLQAFVTADGDCEEQGVSMFDIEEVHKIAILDIRLANCDRNGGNILVRKLPNSDFQLIPIDHGYCLPASFMDINFEWMYWPQASKKFSPRSIEYIAQLDYMRDEYILNDNGLPLRPECNEVRKVCTILLQKACQQNMTPAQIGKLMCRENLLKSPLEKLHTSVVQSHKIKPGENSDLYLKLMSEAFDEILHENI